MPLEDLWASFFGPSSPSASTLPFVNDDNWAIWSDWGDSCSLLDEQGQTLHATPQDHWRDLYILDQEGAVYAVYNLTDNNLSDAANYETIKNVFLGAYNP